jgi:predicted DCC family thiol-disulfide oxidoreductase YuxK
VDVDGRTQAGHCAVASVLRASRRPWPVLGRAMLLPGVSWVAARVYGWVAANRHRLPGGTPACALPPEERPGARPG